MKEENEIVLHRYRGVSRTRLAASGFALGAVQILTVLLIGAPSINAESFPITIKHVRFGLPPGAFVTERDEHNQPRPLFKAAAWAPIQITMDFIGTTAIPDQEIEIIVSTPDGDDVVSEARFRMPAPSAGREEGVRLARNLFLKPGGVASEINVQIVGTASRQPLAAAYQQRLLGLPPSRYLLLSGGSTLSGLRLPKTEGQTAESSTDADSLRNGWVQLAVAGAADLPDRWFGYDAVDLLILNAAEEEFWRQLAADPHRCQAIAEWVRRGGHILINGGAGAQIQRIPQLKEMLPVAIDDAAKRSLSELALVLPGSPRYVMKAQAPGAIPVMTVKPLSNRPSQTKLLADERDQPFPLVVQAPYGLGRVTLVAFDLDRAPFEDWQHREAFWEWLLNSAGTRLPGGSEPLSTDARGDDEDKYLTRLQNNLEFFEGVPVVSFGWVALLILLYIALFGPLEYLILKKLLKRMELTWITLPIIVISVCLASAFAAYELKGSTLRINKVDLVEIDLRTKRAYGQTWFTVYSPRIQNLTIGVEPLWAHTAPEDMLVSWHGKAKNARQSLFRRTYQYHSSIDPDVFADGLERVPIQVWSTKSFTARWSAALEKPLIESTLHIAAADPNQVTGSITSHLPSAVIIDAQLFYRDRVTPLPPLLPGIPRFIATNPQAASPTSWLHNEISQKDLILSNRSSRAVQGDFEQDPRFRLWPMLFHELVQGQFGRLYNSSVRDLDQSWRIAEKNPHEAILVMRLRGLDGPAEAMSNAPDTPSRLWLNVIPGYGQRLPIEGTLRQETYIRVYVPIGPAIR